MANSILSQAIQSRLRLRFMRARISAARWLLRVARSLAQRIAPELEGPLR